MKKFKIVIATVTRNRPKMLINLYRSLSELYLPGNVDVEFLVVENNQVSTSDIWLQEIATQLGSRPITYSLETNIGISCARNRALDYAKLIGADFLVFVDDDEQAKPDWLQQLFAEQQRLDFDIVGSPVRPQALEGRLNLWQRLIGSGVERNSTKAELRARKKWQENRGDTIKVATGSWLGKLDFFRKTGLRFDSQLRLTGGGRLESLAKSQEIGCENRLGSGCNSL